MEALLNSKKLKIALLIIVLVILGVFGIITYRNNQGNTENSPLGKSDPVEDSSSSTGISTSTSQADILDEKSLDKDDGEQIIYMQKEEVYSFSMTDTNGIVLGFEKQDDKWIYTDDPDLPINQDRIDKILNYLCDIHFSDCIEKAKGEDYGLDQNSKTFTIQDSSGDAIIISINDKLEEDKIYFAVNYDFSTIFINSGKLGNVCEYDIKDLIKR